MLSTANSQRTSVRALAASLALHLAAAAALITFDFGALAAPQRFASTIVAIARSPTLPEPDLSFLQRNLPAPPRAIPQITSLPPLRADLVGAVQGATPPRPTERRLAAAPAPKLEVEAPRFETYLPATPPPPTAPRTFDVAAAARASKTAAIRASGFQLAKLISGSPKLQLPVATAGFSPGQTGLPGPAAVRQTAVAGFAGAQSAAAAGSAPRTTAGGFGRASTSVRPAPPAAPERPADFGGVVARREAKNAPRPTSPASAEQPPKILAKPRPRYTEAARAQGVEGDALLEVLLSKSGDVRVLRVIKGLGHGLDEQAIEAARHVRFEPALRDGRPVDAVVTLRIRFQLAL